MEDKKQEILCGREPMVINEEKKEETLYGREPMVVNEERKKHGLVPISGGDVAITRISDSNKELSP